MRKKIENSAYMTAEEIRLNYIGKWVLIANAEMTPDMEFIGGIPIVVADNIYEGHDDGFYAEFVDDEDTLVGDAGNRRFRIRYTDSEGNVRYSYANVNINKTTPPHPPAPEILDAMFGQRLYQLTLPDGWEWVTSYHFVGDVGFREHRARFEHENPNHYVIYVYINVEVFQATPIYELPKGLISDPTLPMYLSQIVLPNGWEWVAPSTPLVYVGYETFVASYTCESGNFYTVYRDVTVYVVLA